MWPFEHKHKLHTEIQVGLPTAERSTLRVSRLTYCLTCDKLDNNRTVLWEGVNERTS